jgi:hypothetical protein
MTIKGSLRYYFVSSLFSLTTEISIKVSSFHKEEGGEAKYWAAIFHVQNSRVHHLVLTNCCAER